MDKLDDGINTADQWRRRLEQSRRELLTVVSKLELVLSRRLSLEERRQFIHAVRESRKQLYEQNPVPMEEIKEMEARRVIEKWIARFKGQSPPTPTDS